MCPELFEIPFIHLTLKSYGLMMVVGFLSAVALIRRLSRDITPSPHLITNAALYSLIGGVVGARVFYVIHHFDQFRENLPSVFAVWNGGLELLGGVTLAIIIIFFYLWYHKLPIRQYLDILAIGLMLALVFGRMGCFLNGCCFGKPTKLSWGIRFPYGSFAYRSQIHPNLQRNRPNPHLELPDGFFSRYNSNGETFYGLKPFEDLNQEQKNMVKNGKYRCLPVHPTQLYSSVNAAILCVVLYFFWRRSQNAVGAKKTDKLFTKPGSTFSLMFILYGITRFLIEFLRDDNPFEFDSMTISQIISAVLIAVGVLLVIIFHKIKPRSFSR